MKTDELRAMLHYDPDTGHFTWIRKVSRKVVVGERAGSLNGSGYRQIRIGGKIYSEQRLAFLYMTGDWPAGQVDHKDRDRANNRWENLRVASNAQNSRNRPPCLGFVTVSGGYVARIRVNGRRMNIGKYSTPEAATAAYALASYLYFGEFSNA